MSIFGKMMQGAVSLCIGAHVVGDGRLFGGLGRADDRGVAGAAAQVARQRVVVVCPAVQVGRGHGHDKPRRAEPALAAVVVHHGRLHGVKRAVGGGDPFHGAHGLTLQLWQEQDAGVQGPRALCVRDHHAAGPAVAFVAAFLGAGQPAGVAQPVQQGLGRVALHLNGLSVQKKRNLHDIARRGTRYVSERWVPSMRRRGHPPVIGPMKAGSRGFGKGADAVRGFRPMPRAGRPWCPIRCQSPWRHGCRGLPHPRETVSRCSGCHRPAPPASAAR